MIKLETAHFIQELLSYLIAYFPTVAITGYIEAYVAKVFGDKTPEYSGFLSLNPIVHMDPLGVAIVALPPHFGFGRRIPLNLDNIDNKFKNLKICFLFMSRALAHIFLIFVTLLLFSLVGKNSFFYLSEGNLHPTMFSVILILNSLLNLNILSAVIYFIIGLIRICIHYLFPDIEGQPGGIQLLIFLFPFLMLIVLGPYVEVLLRIFLIKFLGLF